MAGLSGCAGERAEEGHRWAGADALAGRLCRRAGRGGAPAGGGGRAGWAGQGRRLGGRARGGRGRARRWARALMGRGGRWLRETGARKDIEGKIREIWVKIKI